MKVPSWISALAAVFLLAGCSDMLKGREAGQQAVDEFHKLYNSEKYAEIFTGADPDFGRTTTLPDLKKFLEAVQRKLGPARSAKEVGWRVNAINGKTQVVLNEETEFEKGRAEESFTFIMHDGKALLYGYHINSPELIQ